MSDAEERARVAKAAEAGAPFAANLLDRTREKYPELCTPIADGRGPPLPLPGCTGTKYDPPWAWLFGKNVYGPPDPIEGPWR